jgi:hypothetical protein
MCHRETIEEQRRSLAYKVTKHSWSSEVRYVGGLKDNRRRMRIPQGTQILTKLILYTGDLHLRTVKRSHSHIEMLASLHATLANSLDGTVKLLLERLVYGRARFVSLSLYHNISASSKSSM